MSQKFSKTYTACFVTENTAIIVIFNYVLLVQGKDCKLIYTLEKMMI